MLSPPPFSYYPTGLELAIWPLYRNMLVGEFVKEMCPDLGGFRSGASSTLITSLQLFLGPVG